VKVTVVRNVTPCSLVTIYQHFLQTHFFHIQGERVRSRGTTLGCFDSFTLQEVTYLQTTKFPSMCSHNYMTLYRKIILIHEPLYPLRRKHTLYASNVSCRIFDNLNIQFFLEMLFIRRIWCSTRINWHWKKKLKYERIEDNARR